MTRELCDSHDRESERTIEVEKNNKHPGLDTIFRPPAAEVRKVAAVSRLPIWLRGENSHEISDEVRVCDGARRSLIQQKTAPHRPYRYGGAAASATFQRARCCMISVVDVA